MSSKQIPFLKFQGNGNDFIFLDKEALSLFKSTHQLREYAKNVCQRGFSVGADGVVFYDDSHNRIMILNSDGSFAATCGNALRCYGLHLLQQNRWDGKTPLEVKRLVPSFVENVHLEDGESFVTTKDVFATLLVGNLNNSLVSVAMGAEKHVEIIPSTNNPFHLHDLRCAFIQLENPHLVFFSESFASFGQEETIKFGKWAQTAFIQGFLGKFPVSNISIISTLSGHGISNLVVFERGAGLTLCCGSGAVASRVALEAFGLVSPSEIKIQFNLPGGPVEIQTAEINGKNQRILIAAARQVYKGMMEWL